MDKLLKVKHWLVFLLTILVPGVFILSGFFIPSYYLKSSTYLFFFIPSSIAMSQVFIYLWMWGVGFHLYKRYNLKRFYNNNLFKLFVIIPVIIIMGIMSFWLWGASILSMGTLSMANVLSSALLIIMPIQALFIVTKFYCFYFAAKVIRSAEKDKALGFEGFATDFVLLLVFPIGIWFIQPRVNRLIKQLE